MGLPGFCVMLLFICPCKRCVDEKEVSGSSDWLHTGRNAFRKIHWDSGGCRKSQKQLKNEKADCFALRKRIARLKWSIL